MRYPAKYTKNGSERLIVGDFTDALGRMIDDGADDKELAEFIDREFLWGAWGFLAESIRNNPPGKLFLADLRGAIVSAYKSGKAT